MFAAPVNTNGTAFVNFVPERMPFPPNAGIDFTPQSSRDGRRFLIEVADVQQAVRTSISVVLNWQALFKQ